MKVIVDAILRLCEKGLMCVHRAPTFASRCAVKKLSGLLYQGSTISIKSLYVIMYVGQNFGIHDVCRQIPKSKYQVSYFKSSDFLNNLSCACCYFF